MSRGLKYSIILFVAAGILLEVLLPALVSQLVAQGMANASQSEHVTASLTKRPAIFMLGGSFDQVELAADNLNTGRIRFSSMQVKLQQVQLNMGKLISQRQIEFQKLGDIQVQGVVTQEELARYLNQSVKGVKNAQVSITPDKVKATSAFALGGLLNVSIGLEGRVVGEGQQIKFVTERFFINNLQTGSIAGTTLTEIPLADVSKLPFPVAVRNIRLEEGRIVVELDNRQGQ